MSGRIRTIKPELLEDEKTASLSDSEFRVFIGLLLLADDYGNFRANPTWVRSQIYWARDDVGQIRETLATLSRLSLVSLYTVSGQQYGHISGWSKHQRVDKPGKPRVPSRPIKNTEENNDVGQIRETLARPSQQSHGTLAPDLRSPTYDLRPGAGRECEGNQPDETPTEPDASTEPDPLPVAVATGPAPSDESKTDEKPDDNGKVDQPTPEPRGQRKTRLPDDWAYNPKHEAKARELGLDINAEAEAFRDFHGGHGTTMLKWDLAFHTWLRNAVKFGPAPGKAPEPVYLEIPDDTAPAMSLAEALQFCPPEHRAPIQEFLGGVR